MNIDEFRSIVYSHAAQNSRDMPWRHNTQPYYIHVSEMMLQQTQVNRVIPKFNAFIEAIPDYEALAKAPLTAVLQQWSGLGYNRRAQYLKVAAIDVMQHYNGVLPNDAGALISLAGIGPNTAAAIQAYAFNEPVAFIETNIRTVFIHHYFPKRSIVADKELMPLIRRALDTEQPRQWYWALMDYGTLLKQTVGNASRASKHYKKQTRFEGSSRQIRGRIIRMLITGPVSKTDSNKGVRLLTAGNRLYDTK